MDLLLPINIRSIITHYGPPQLAVGDTPHFDLATAQ